MWRGGLYLLIGFLISWLLEKAKRMIEAMANMVKAKREQADMMCIQKI